LQKAGHAAFRYHSLFNSRTDTQYPTSSNVHKHLAITKYKRAERKRFDMTRVVATCGIGSFCHADFEEEFGKMVDEKDRLFKLNATECQQFFEAEVGVTIEPTELLVQEFNFFRGCVGPKGFGTEKHTGTVILTETNWTTWKFLIDWVYGGVLFTKLPIQKTEYIEDVFFGQGYLVDKNEIRDCERLLHIDRLVDMYILADFLLARGSKGEILNEIDARYIRMYDNISATPIHNFMLLKTSLPPKDRLVRFAKNCLVYTASDKTLQLALYRGLIDQSIIEEVQALRRQRRLWPLPPFRSFRGREWTTLLARGRAERLKSAEL